MLPQRRYQLEFGQPEGGYLEDLPIGLVNKLEAERVTKGSLRKAECDLGPLGIYEILGQLLHSNHITVTVEDRRRVDGWVMSSAARYHTQPEGVTPPGQGRPSARRLYNGSRLGNSYRKPSVPMLSRSLS